MSQVLPTSPIKAMPSSTNNAPTSATREESKGCDSVPEDAPSRLRLSQKHLMGALDEALLPHGLIHDLVPLVASYVAWSPRGLVPGSLVDIYDLIAGEWWVLKASRCRGVFGWRVGVCV